MRVLMTLARAPYWGFVTFGAFWGVWGASIPRLRAEAGVTDAELGVALLFVGAGALPAMFSVGRLVDRLGLWVTGPILVSLSVAGVVVASTAQAGIVALCIGMAIVGATSGAADVCLNSLAGRAEQAAGRPVITPAQGTFSAIVVVATLTTGALNSTSLPPPTPFLLVVVVAVIACALIVGGTRMAPTPAGDSGSDQHLTRTPTQPLSIALLLGIGALGALAFATENAHQSWSAVFLEDDLTVPLGFSAFGPAVFAAVVAITRFSVAPIAPRHARTLLVSGAAAATIGTAGFALAPSLPVALVALALAAAGTAVLFPTLIGIVSRRVPEERRGRATSLLTVVAYTGFLAGPPYVGLLSGAFNLSTALLGVAALTAIMTLLTPFVIRPTK